MSRRGPRWARRLACRLLGHRVEDRHFANGCAHLCSRCSWGVGVVPGPGVPFRTVRARDGLAVQRDAVDYLLAVLAGDVAGRDAARERLLVDPASAVAGLGLLVLALTPDTVGRNREALQRLAALGELRAAVGGGS